MSILKIVTILNWVVITILGFVVIADALSPTKGGGDAAGRGYAQAYYSLAVIALFVLLGLSLLPYSWAKYTAFALILAPVVFTILGSVSSSIKQKIAQIADRAEASKPIFEDKERESIARAIYGGNIETVKKILQTPVPRLNENGELLCFVVNKTSSSDDKIEERVECIRLLFQAGARLDSTSAAGEYPLHMTVAAAGNAPLLRLLLEQGADANANYVKRPILFEAVGSYQQPEASVRVLLEFGADPNATAVFDDEDGLVSPIWSAAKLERWGVCNALLEHGADPEFKTSAGKAFRDLVQESARDFPADGYTTQADYERLKKALAQAGKGRTNDKR